jgi:hypothetical protein
MLASLDAPSCATELKRGVIALAASQGCLLQYKGPSLLCNTTLAPSCTLQLHNHQATHVQHTADSPTTCAAPCCQ